MCNKRLLRNQIRNWGVAVANKDGGAHRDPFMTQQCSIPPMAWAIMGVMEEIADIM